MLWLDCPASPATWVEPQGREQNLAAVLDVSSCRLRRQKRKQAGGSPSLTATLCSFMSCKDCLGIDADCLALIRKYILQGLVSQAPGCHVNRVRGCQPHPCPATQACGRLQGEGRDPQLDPPRQQGLGLGQLPLSLCTHVCLATTCSENIQESLEGSCLGVITLPGGPRLRCPRP